MKRMIGTGGRRQRRPGAKELAFALVANLALVVALLLSSPTLRAIAFQPAAWDQVGPSVMHEIANRIAEQPHLAGVPGSASYPVCTGVDAAAGEALADGFNLMRRTPEGLRLFGLLVAEGVCVRTAEIPYNSGYATIEQSITGSWSRSTITVATRHTRGAEPDVLAALLVHEATHVDRYVRGLACAYSDSCTILANGVDLGEEVAAHRAEADWWIAAYGTDGKRFALGYAYGLNELVEAYNRGDDAFRAYVRSMRGDRREGDGVAPG